LSAVDLLRSAASSENLHTEPAVVEEGWGTAMSTHRTSSRSTRTRRFVLF
jgi:hypothetical protein